MEKPVPFIVSIQSGHLGVNQEALKTLRNITQPVTVVSIAGLYRTGKSYIMNRLFGKSKGFELGSTVQAKTKGIWMWCRPHPLDSGRYLILLDTEGLSDPEEGDAKYDMAIFSLAILLSTCFIYNSTGAINQHAIDQLHLVSELTDHIKIKSSAGDESGENFDQFFPTFIWVVRDFTLEKVINEKEVTSDEYLEHCLELRKGQGRKVREFNLPRETLKQFFRTRRCFTMPRPCAEESLNQVEELPDSEINSEFLKTMDELTEFIFNKVQSKTIDGELVNGSMLGGLAESYVDAITKGGIPCIETAVETMSKIECEKAIKNGVEKYYEVMDKDLQLPTSLETLSSVHSKALKVAISTFLERAIFDKDHAFQKKLQEEIDKHFESFEKKNEELSKKACEELLTKSYEPVKKKVLSGHYMRPGGYKEYLIDREKVKKQYEEAENKGVLSNALYAKFVEEKMTEQVQIMTADKQMTAVERQSAETKARLEAAEQQAKAADDERKRLQEEILLAEKNFKTHAEELQKKHSQEIESYRREQEEILDNRLKNQAEMLQTGFKEQAKVYESTISDLRNEQKARMDKYDKDMSELNNIISQQSRTIEELKNRPAPKKSGCFAANSTIRVQKTDGSIVSRKLRDIKVGDKVESVDPETGHVVFSDVYFITHSEDGGFLGDVLEITAELDKCIKKISLDKFHLIYVTKASQSETTSVATSNPVEAGSVEIGDFLWVRQDDGSLSRYTVVSIHAIHNTPVLHPLTMNHHIIVNDIHASVHMFYEQTCRTTTFPLRMMYWINSSWCESRLVKSIVAFWDTVEEWFPSYLQQKPIKPSPAAFWERIAMVQIE